MVMQVTTGPAFVPGERRALFPLTGYVVGTLGRPQYDVSSDGRRFVMVRTPSADREDQVIVVEHFFRELRAKVGR